MFEDNMIQVAGGLIWRERVTRCKLELQEGRNEAKWVESRLAYPRVNRIARCISHKNGPKLIVQLQVGLPADGVDGFDPVFFKNPMFYNAFKMTDQGCIEEVYVCAAMALYQLVYCVGLEIILRKISMKTKTEAVFGMLYRLCGTPKSVEGPPLESSALSLHSRRRIGPTIKQ